MLSLACSKAHSKKIIRVELRVDLRPKSKEKIKARLKKIKKSPSVVPSFKIISKAKVLEAIKTKYGVAIHNKSQII
jgi:cell division protein FtsX